jgi:hypothetical protein
MRRRIAVACVLVAAVVCALLASVLPALAAPALKIGFCHRTDAVSNPYVYDKTDADSIIKQGHGVHLGPIFPATGINGKWGDIIPPFHYSAGDYPGRNWSARGIFIVSKQCAVQIEPPESSTTTTTVPNESTSTSPGESTTLSTAATTTSATTIPPTVPATPAGGVVTTSTTSAPGGPTTVPSGPKTTIEALTAITALPPYLRPLAGAKIMPPLQAVVVKRAYLYVLLGRLSVPQRKALLVELLRQQQQGRLSFTGASGTQPLTYGAVIAVMTGVAMVLSARRRRR